MLAGCATPPPASDPDAVAEYRQNNDPLEPTNRVFYRINNAIDTNFLAPVARGYRAVVPTRVRDGLHNVLTNMTTSVTLANNILEAKPRRAGDSFMRLVINTTVGVGGIFDVAKGWCWPANDADFVITMALWGVPGGPFLFLPVLGPSDPRDAAGFGADIALDPFTYPSGGSWTVFNWSRYGVSAVDARERRLDDVDQIKKTALDPYATFRSLYQQFRSRQIDDARKDKPRTIPAWFPNPEQGSK
jgi:phospholipid-binding lipoprotein MlaA